jgi:hypothetical protein
VSRGRWRAVAYTPRPSGPCVRCGRLTSHRDRVCNLCAWNEAVELDEERWDQARVRAAEHGDQGEEEEEEEDWFGPANEGAGGGSGWGGPAPNPDDEPDLED